MTKQASFGHSGSQRNLLVSVVAAIAVGVVAYVVTTSLAAQATSTSIEAENATGAQVLSDPTASQSKYIEFIAATGTGGGTGTGTGGGTSSSCGQPAGACTAAEIGKHNSQTDCWVIYQNNYYNVTGFVDKHPGGTQVFNSQVCGHDISPYLSGSQSSAGSQHKHSQNAFAQLESYKVGPVQ